MRGSLGALTALALLTAPAAALDAVVTPRAATARDFVFVSGEVIPELRLGFETYGTLDATGENAVLVSPFFAGDCHAAGKRDPAEPEAGWWDALIGPGLAIDTRRSFVVCTEVLSSNRVKDPSVVTTGPATVDPRTGQRYDLTFPRTTIRDLVRAQGAVLEALGVRRLQAVVGPSLGGMLALAWAVEEPARVERAIAVAAPLQFSDRERQALRNAAATVRSDPAWCLGDYARYGVEPLLGMAMALRGWSAIVAGRGAWLPWLLPGYLAEAGRFEANHYLYMLDLHAGYELTGPYSTPDAAFRRVRAEVTLIGFDDDRFVTPTELRAGRDALRVAGVRADLEVVAGTHGHLSALYDLDALAPALRRALARP